MQVENAVAQNQYKYLGFISAAIVATLIISNISATKFVDIGGFITDGGTLLFPLAYIFGDILTEVYGYKASRRVIYTAFFWLFVAAATFQLVVSLPPSPDYELQESFESILGQTPRIVLGSLLGYFTGEFINSYVLARMKVLTNGKWLWSRTIGSTVLGQAADTSVFLLVAFGGDLPNAVLWEIFVDTYLIKVAIEVVLTPLTYVLIGWLTREEAVDTYDRDTNFNPFAVRELFN